MLVGVDWGGTKLEIIVLDDVGKTRLRKRTDTPKNDYEANILAVVGLVREAETEIGPIMKVGFGIPGTISPRTGLVKNANSTWLNGKPLKQDLEAALGCSVRLQNDANCFAVSEAVDGAGHGHDMVVGVIIGTGCGAGIAIHAEAWSGRQAIAGEFGHTPLPHMNMDEYPGNACWCGRRGCLETYISGTGLEHDYAVRTGVSTKRTAQDILAMTGDVARLVYDAYVDRLARGLSILVNILDPDVLVLGGGMSNADGLYRDLPSRMAPYVFTDHSDVKILKAKHGDSSGVRGAAWLWRKI